MKHNVWHDGSFMAAVIGFDWTTVSKPQTLTLSRSVSHTKLHPISYINGEICRFSKSTWHYCIMSYQKQVVTFGNQVVSILVKVVTSRKGNSCGNAAPRRLN